MARQDAEAFQAGGAFRRVRADFSQSLFQNDAGRIETARDSWRHKHYRVDSNFSVQIERALAVYSAGCFVLAWQLEMWFSLPFLYLFLHGFIYMAFLSFAPDHLLTAHLDRPARQRTAGT